MSGQKTPVKLSARFLRDFKGLPEDIRKEVAECLKDVVALPIPQSRRAHSVTPRGQRPAIHTVDVTSNHAWKMSFLRKGQVLWILRVDTHREIDRDPGRAIAKEVMSMADE